MYNVTRAGRDGYPRFHLDTAPFPAGHSRPFAIGERDFAITSRRIYLRFIFILSLSLSLSLSCVCTFSCEREYVSIIAMEKSIFESALRFSFLHYCIIYYYYYSFISLILFIDRHHIWWFSAVEQEWITIRQYLILSTDLAAMVASKVSSKRSRIYVINRAWGAIE